MHRAMPPVDERDASPFTKSRSGRGTTNRDRSTRVRVRSASPIVHGVRPHADHRRVITPRRFHPLTSRAVRAHFPTCPAQRGRPSRPRLSGSSRPCQGSSLRSDPLRGLTALTGSRTSQKRHLCDGRHIMCSMPTRGARVLAQFDRRCRQRYSANNRPVPTSTPSQRTLLRSTSDGKFGRASRSKADD
jgi:hypothetical protein